MASSSSSPIRRRQTAPFRFPNSPPNSEPNPNSLSPTTPPEFRGIPFSWEQIPGIPKHQITPDKNDEYAPDHLLPILPPPAGNSLPKKILRQEDQKNTRVSRDPFFAALVACSKDDRNNGGNTWRAGGSSKITRSLSDRFGFMNMSAAVSCKSSSAVAESVVYIPRHPSPHYLLHRRPS